MDYPITIGDKVCENVTELLEFNIDTALRDYNRHAPGVEYGEDFVRRLARDAATAKAALREMFRKSPAWDERLQALVINGNRTHEPDSNVIKNIAYNIFQHSCCNKDFDWLAVARWFAYAEGYDEGEWYIRNLAPDAIKEGKKKSRIFRDFCKAVGIWNDEPGWFQREYAKLADEMSSKLIDFKLYVSINPGHFLTMSNPKHDDRGPTMTSCHSLNSDEYTYNNGCSGYARDEVSIIAFTADPQIPETLNNRKTSRQMYAYRPGSGILLQSRLYSTNSGGSYGGMNGEQPESKLYRDLIEREISFCEDVPNLWKVLSTNETYKWTERSDAFNGYPDWEYEHFAPHIALRTGHEDKPLHIGAAGLCLICGSDDLDGRYCEDCDPRFYCYECDERTREDSLYTVYRHGEEVQVCSCCRERYYSWCHECGEYHHDSDGSYINGEWVCDDCRDEYYTACAYCGEYYRTDDMTETNDGLVCECCLDDHYRTCDECGEYHRCDEATKVHKDGIILWVCEDCLGDYTECDECGEYFYEVVERVDPETGVVTTLCADCAEKNESEAA